MKRTLLIVMLVLVLTDLTGLRGLSGLAQAQTGSGYELTWWTVDGGGVMNATGGAYTLGGAAGQPDASAALAGGGFTLVGGFWGVGGPAGEPARYSIYLPLVIK
jgi:hypothetical protein